MQYSEVLDKSDPSLGYFQPCHEKRLAFAMMNIAYMGLNEVPHNFVTVFFRNSADIVILDKTKGLCINTETLEVDYIDRDDDMYYITAEEYNFNENQYKRKRHEIVYNSWLADFDPNFHHSIDEFYEVTPNKARILQDAGNSDYYKIKKAEILKGADLSEPQSIRITTAIKIKDFEVLHETIIKGTLLEGASRSQQYQLMLEENEWGSVVVFESKLQAEHPIFDEMDNKEFLGLLNINAMIWMFKDSYYVRVIKDKLKEMGVIPKSQDSIIKKPILKNDEDDLLPF